MTDRTTRFGLDDYGLVVSEPEVVIGNPLGEAVHVPIQGRLHRRHAMLVRDRGGYRLIPYTGCKTLVNGTPVVGAAEVRHGDVLELGGPHCQWRFLLPVEGSGTAVLEQVGPAGACVLTAEGRQYRRVFLLDDRLEIRARRPAHLVLPDLCCEALDFRWSPGGLAVEAREATVVVEASGADDAGPSPVLWVPCRLAIHSELSEAERLGRAMEGRELPDVLHLEIRSHFR